MGNLVVERAFECRSDPERLWEALSDTNRLNHAMGLAPVEVQPAEAGPARFLCSSRLAGMTLSFEEQPYAWEEHRRMSIARRFRNGPASEYSLSWELEPTEAGGTRVVQRMALAPRSFLLRPFVALNAYHYSSKLKKTLLAADEHLVEGLSPFAGAPLSPCRMQAMERAADELRELSKDAAGVDALVQFLATAEDLDVARMRPFELADAWAMERSRVLSLCLQAVVAGLLELSWDVLCPSCQTAAQSFSELSALEDQVHCQLCDLTSGVAFDKSVEASFRPSEAIRNVPTGPYCIGGPARTPHVVSQLILTPGETASLTVPQEPGRYRFFARGGLVLPLEVTPGGQSSLDVLLGDNTEASELAVAPGGTLLLTDQFSEGRHVKLERLQYQTDAATAHDVAATDTFRRIFSSQALRAGHALKVSRVALLFTDLVGSTDLYSNVGDARAYALVQGHFDVLRRVVEANGGAVVKTIGDAVMAAFRDDADAVRAALNMQRAFSEFVATTDDAPHIGLRVGVHAGPSYTVNANGALDYFGQTVNIAARLEGLANAGEVVLSAAVASAHDLGKHDCVAFEAELKGINEHIACVKVGLGKHSLAEGTGVFSSAPTRDIDAQSAAPTVPPTNVSGDPDEAETS